MLARPDARRGLTPEGPVLVLVSFALVLLAAGLLLVGLAVDSGLTLIYASIGCSLVAGILLILATRGRQGSTAAGPAVAPVHQVSPGDGAEDDLAGPEDHAAIWAPPPPPRPAAPATPAPPTSPPPPRTSPPPPPSPPPATADADAGVPAAGVPVLAAEEDYLFPIGNYEQRPVAEILPLLTHLYEDELAMVEARERRGAQREAVLSRVHELQSRFGGSSATGGSSAAGSPPSPAAVPIPGYATLRVPEVRAAIGSLSLGELEQVRVYEEAGDRRPAVLEAVERRRADLAEGAGAPPTGDPPEPAPS